MNILDLGIILILVVSTIISIFRGFTKEIFSLLAWILAIFCAVNYSKPFSISFLTIQNELIRQVISGSIIFMSIIVLGSMLSSLISKTVKYIGLGAVDRFIAIPFGVVRAAFFMSIAVMFLISTNLQKEEWWINSTLLPKLEEISFEMQKVIPKEWIENLIK